LGCSRQGEYYNESKTKEYASRNKCEGGEETSAKIETDMDDVPIDGFNPVLAKTCTIGFPFAFLIVLLTVS
jgi:hypothetical protein